MKFISILLTVILIGCSLIEESRPTAFSSNQNQITFIKSQKYDWNNKKIEVSFEDEFQVFSSVEFTEGKKTQKSYLLSDNNLQQGVTIKLKVTDTILNLENVNEIRIEAYDLQKGKNQFTIGFNSNKPYIIY